MGVARGCSDPRCAENRVQRQVPKKIGKWGGCNTLLRDTLYADDEISSEEGGDKYGSRESSEMKRTPSLKDAWEADDESSSGEGGDENDSSINEFFFDVRLDIGKPSKEVATIKRKTRSLYDINQKS